MSALLVRMPYSYAHELSLAPKCSSNFHNAGKTALGTKAQPLIPMEVTGAMDSDGLGCVAWWVPEAEDMEQ